MIAVAPYSGEDRSIRQIRTDILRELLLLDKQRKQLDARVVDLESASTAAAVTITGSSSSDILELTPNNSSASIMAANHASLQTAMTAIGSAGGGELIIGRGTFYVDTDNLGPLLYPQNITIRGLNRIASRVQGNGAGAVFAPANGSTYSTSLSDRTLNVLFSNLAIWNTSQATAGGICLDARQVSNSRFEFLDLRTSETGLYVGNIAYANAFTSIQASSCDTAFICDNGANENDFTDCRASGIDLGFLLDAGANNALNAITVDKCTVESFTDAAIRVRADTSDSYSDLRFMNNRFTSGPTGFDFVESSTGEILNVLVAGTHDDGVLNLLEWTIGGVAYTAGPNTTTTAIMGGRRAIFIHQGKIWPVRPGFRDTMDSNAALLMYTTSSNQVAVRANVDSANADLTANDISAVTNGPGTERVTFPRARAAGGSDHVAGDYGLSTGWGNTAAVTVTAESNDAHGRITILCQGSGIAANPSVTLTFADGAYPTTPFTVCSRGDSNATAGEWRRTALSTTIQTWTFFGTPVAGESYVLDFMVIG